jgi:hypothetical protein
MAERAPDPVAVALAFAIREAKHRQVAEEAERRRTMTLVDGGKRKGAAA